MCLSKSGWADFQYLGERETRPYRSGFLTNHEEAPDIGETEHRPAPQPPGPNRLETKVPGELANFQRVNAIWLTLFRQVELSWTGEELGNVTERPPFDIKAFIFLVLEYIYPLISSSGGWYLPCFSTDGIGIPSEWVSLER